MNIALIAMSGIRVCDAELLEMGLTLPGFVERSKTIAALPSLGLLTLAGLTPARHTVRYLEVPDLRAMAELPGGVDLAAISSYSAQIEEAYQLAQRWRAARVPVVLGGPHVSALPDEAGTFADAVVQGEGEACWADVLRDAEAGRLQPRYGSADHPFDLAAAPVPAYELLPLERYNRLTVQTSRGCPHHCEFCAGSVLLTPRYKQKPVARVLHEMDRIQELWPHPFLEFADDNSMVDRDYWMELLGRLKHRGLRWFAETDLRVGEDAELLELMRASGCAQVLIGLESPSADGLRGLELRNDWKYRQFPSYRDRIASIQAHGITVNGCFILGLDHHTPAIFDEVYDFVRETGLYEVQVTLLTPFPGTPLYARLEREGRLTAPRQWSRCTLFDINFRPARMTAEELGAGFKQLVARLYSADCTRRRRARFKQQLHQRRRREDPT